MDIIRAAATVYDTGCIPIVKCLHPKGLNDFENYHKKGPFSCSSLKSHVVPAPYHREPL